MGESGAGGSGYAVGSNFALGMYYSASDFRAFIDFPCIMRATPTVASSSTTNAFRIIRANGSDYPDLIQTAGGTAMHGAHLFTNDDLGGTAGDGAMLINGGTADAFISFDAEL